MTTDTIGSYTFQDIPPATHHRYLTSCPALDEFGKLVRILQLSGSETKDYIDRITRLCQTPHPSVFRVIKTIGSSVICEAYMEDLSTFIMRRRERGHFLTPAELLWVYRQLVAALRVWFDLGINHKAICPANVFIARNGQNQLVFKIGDLDIEDHTHHSPEQQMRQAIDGSSDMYSLGLIFYEIATLSLLPTSDLQAAKAQMRADLELKDSALRQRYAAVDSALNVVQDMIHDDRSKRTVPKNVQIALAAINWRDFEKTCSVEDEPIVPAGSGDAITKTAQAGARESQWQLTLLLRERGHAAQTLAWCHKAAEQGHVKAQKMCGSALMYAQGCTRDHEKAEIWFRKAVEQKDIDALYQLGQLLFLLTKEKDAFETLGAAAIANHTEAQFNLARMLYLGRGCVKDQKQALFWMEKAAKQKHPQALFYCAMSIKTGEDASGYLQKCIERLDANMCLRQGRSIITGFASLLQSYNILVLDSFNWRPTFTELASCVFRGNMIDMEQDFVLKAITDAPIPTLLQQLLMLLELPKHPNLLSFTGICGDFEHGSTVKAPLSFVMPYFPNGSVIDFLTKSENKGRSAELLVSWALDIATALKVLHDHAFVHREVSAHNIFIDEKQHAVLGGFDQVSFSNNHVPRVRLSRNSQKSVRNHVAPEDAVKEIVCKSAGDIFCFGLALCEIAHETKFGFYSWSSTVQTEEALFDWFTKTTPSDYQELVKYLPSHVSAPVRELIQACLDFEPTKRPTAKQLMETLTNILGRTENLDAPVTIPTSLAPDVMFDKAMRIYETNPKTALILLRHAASKGLRAAQRQAADMLMSGSVVAQSKEDAFRFYHMASLHDGAYESQNRLGRLFLERGQYPEAVLWLQKSADGGDVDALYWLARCYYLGQGVERSLKQAETLLRQATTPSPGPMATAAIHANILLSIIFDLNGKHDDATACILAATSTGDSTAQLLMAMRWNEGFGTNSKDAGRANTWIQQAARHSDTPASIIARLIIELSNDNFIKRHQLINLIIPAWKITGQFIKVDNEYSCTMAEKKVLISVLETSPSNIRTALQSCMRQDSNDMGLAVALDAVDIKSRTSANIPLGIVRLDEKTSNQETQTTASVLPLSAAEYLRLAFQYFFGLDVLRNLELSREFLVKAAESKPSDPNCQLAKAILSLSSNPLDEKSPLRFFVPGDDFQPPFIELDTTVYRVPGRAFKCSIIGRTAVLVAPAGQSDIVSLLHRCTYAHPNVIGSIGITAGVRTVSSSGARDTLSIALLYSPARAAPADRSMIADPDKACSRLFPFLVGAAEGLAHLHHSNVLHGNVSLPYMLVGHDRLGLIATGPPSCIRPTAPESLASNHFSWASDVFHFGLTIAFMLTGGSFEDAWHAHVGDVDPKTRLARLGASAANQYMDIRSRIPKWVPQPLVDIMMRCLRLDRSQRPNMEMVAVELQTLRSTLARSGVAVVGPCPAQFWMHSSHICSELTADDTWLRVGGKFECLYGPRLRDRMHQNHNAINNRCRIVQGKPVAPVHSKLFPSKTSALDDPNLTPETRKVIKYKSRFFIDVLLSSWDGSEVPSRGIRHKKSWARGAMLPADKELMTWTEDHFNNPPCYPFQKVECSGEEHECKCERNARPKNPKILLIGLANTTTFQQMTSYLDISDYGALAGVCTFTSTACEQNTAYWLNLIKQHGNQGRTYIPLQNYEIKNQFNPIFESLIRRWGKIVGIQQIYTRAYTSMQLETADILHIPDITREERKHLIDKAHTEHKAKKHACALCRKSVVFDDHFADQNTKAVGGVFMACPNCLEHNVWTTPDACTLWAFTMKQLEKVPFWRSSTEKRFCTADLLEFRQRKALRKKLKTGRKKINAEMQKRYVDLPEHVRAFVLLDPSSGYLVYKPCHQPRI